MIEEKLQKFGLSEKGARVYAVLQRLGTSVVSDIAKKSGINRSTAYVLLDALAKRGLVSISERGGIRVFSPAPAERFVQMAESSLEKWSSLATLGQELLMEFKKESRGAEVKPTVQFFEGAEGIKTSYEMMLIPKELSRSYSALSVTQDALPDFFSIYRKRQTTKGVRARTVVPDTPRNREIMTNDAESFSEYFLAPSDGYASDFLISGNRVAFISLTEPSAFVVEDAAFAALQKTLFDAFLTKARCWNVRPEEKKRKSQKRHPMLVKAEKRFFSV